MSLSRNNPSNGPHPAERRQSQTANICPTVWPSRQHKSSFGAVRNSAVIRRTASLLVKKLAFLRIIWGQLRALLKPLEYHSSTACRRLKGPPQLDRHYAADVFFPAWYYPSCHGSKEFDLILKSNENSRLLTFALTNNSKYFLVIHVCFSWKIFAKILNEFHNRRIHTNWKKNISAI